MYQNLHSISVFYVNHCFQKAKAKISVTDWTIHFFFIFLNITT